MASGKPLVRDAHAGEFGLAALGRHLAPGEQRGVGRHALERAVGVPHLVARVEEVAAIAPRDQAVLAVDVGEIGDLRAVFRVRDDGADGRLERPEAAAERDLRLVVERLSPEEQHRVLLERRGDAPEDVGIDAGDVDADDLDAQEWIQRSRLQCRHFLSLRSS